MKSSVFVHISKFDFVDMATEMQKKNGEIFKNQILRSDMRSNAEILQKCY